MTERDDLLNAADQLLTEVTALMSTAPLSDTELEQKIALALTARILKLAHVVHRLCVADCAVDAEPVARAMLSGAASLIFMLDYDVKRRAALFLVEGQKQENRRLERLRRNGMLTKERLGQHIKEANTSLEQALMSHNLGGVNRQKYDAEKTWSGLSDRVVFELMGWSDWYDMYAAFSANIHVSASSLVEAISEIEARSIDISRSGGDPYLVVIAMNISVPQVLFQLEKLFKWGKHAEIEAIGARLAAAIHTYASAQLKRDSLEHPT